MEELTSRRRRLSEVVNRVAPLCVLGDDSDVHINSVEYDHRKVRPGSLFCCLVGEHRDGHDFVEAARLAGAVAFICEHSLGEAAGGAVQLVVPPGTARAAMARAAAAFYGDPASGLSMIGVTGTNGKTTTTFLVRAILESAGIDCGVVGTLSGERTTPEAPDLHRLLSEQRDAGRGAVAMEVSSHALVLDRVEAITFDVAVFTNLTQDHLDFHKTMEAYFEAKAMLFAPGRSRVAVVNADDPYGQRLLERGAIRTVGYSISDAVELSVGVRESTFRLDGELVRLRLGGRFNVMNALAAARAMRELGIGPAIVAEGLSNAGSVPGRFETIEVDGIVAVIDYAHTPNGLEEVLHSAREALNVPSDSTPQGRGHRLVVVFGAGGDRDRGKRPAMGQVAAELADGVVLTNDNPRSEDPLAIIAEIRAGMPSDARVVVEPDRRRAIALALRQAQPGDVVVIAGKGHETTQRFADREVHFDDREVVAEELGRMSRTSGGRGRVAS